MYNEITITNALDAADCALKYLMRAQSMLNDIASISIIDLITNKAKVSIMKELLFNEAEHYIWDAQDEIGRLKCEVNNVLRNQSMQCQHRRLACLMDSICDYKYLNRVSCLRLNKALKRIRKVISQVEAIKKELERM